MDQESLSILTVLFARATYESPMHSCVCALSFVQFTIISMLPKKKDPAMCFIISHPSVSSSPPVHKLMMKEYNCAFGST